jgi:transposase
MRQAADSVGVSASTVSDLLRRAEVAGLSWPLSDDIDDAALERIVYPAPNYSHNRPEPDWNYVHTELSKKGVTLSLLWQEYKEANPQGYQFTQFCEHYRRWRKAQNITFRQVHKAGEKTFSDFAGKTLKIRDAVTGEEKKVYLFVTTLGASNYSYAEAFLAQDTEAWTTGHVHAFEYFGGAPRVIVPDNPKAAVISASNYEPILNESFRQMAAHYGCAVLPARVRKPKDKAKVESAVGLHERWIIARLRNRTFFSLRECNEAIRELLDQVNARPFQKLPDCRKIAFETIDKPALQPRQAIG